MAYVKKNILGNLTGKIGNVSARIYKGNSVFSALPGSFKMSMDENAVSRRDKFKISVKMASAIFKSTILKEVWNYYNNSSHSSRNYVMKLNYKSFDENNMFSETNQLTPFTGTRFSYDTLVIGEENLSFQLDLSQFSFKDDTLIFVFALFQFANSINGGLDLINYGLLESAGIPYSETNQYSVSIPFSDEVYAYSKSYTDKKLLISVVTFNSNGELANYSSSKFVNP